MTYNLLGQISPYIFVILLDRKIVTLISPSVNEPN